MGNGAIKNNGITLCTDGFTLQEVVLLINILILKFDIQPTLHKEKGNFRIYINHNNLLKLYPYIKLHFHSDMLYKIQKPACRVPPAFADGINKNIKH
jgi:hypothetical protein